MRQLRTTDSSTIALGAAAFRFKIVRHTAGAADRDEGRTARGRERESDGIFNEVAIVLYVTCGVTTAHVINAGFGSCGSKAPFRGLFLFVAGLVVAIF